MQRCLTILLLIFLIISPIIAMQNADGTAASSSQSNCQNVLLGFTCVTQEKFAAMSDAHKWQLYQNSIEVMKNYAKQIIDKNQRIEQLRGSNELLRIGATMTRSPKDDEKN